jgi:two-component system OmpR family response regulator
MHAENAAELPPATDDETRPEWPEWTDLPPRPRRATNPRILVVDDDYGFLELAATVLSAEGFEVRVARTPGEAVVWAVREPPDVVLLDIMLRDADGIDVLEALRNEPETRNTTVLACTALGARESGALLTHVGFDGVVAKPFDMARFARHLRDALPARTG